MRIVAHFDMDAFFAACEERYNPHLHGKPIVVGANPKDGQGRGVVSTANYAARRYGIKSAMPISRAWRLAEDAKKRGEQAAVFLTGNFALYGEVSQRVMAILEAEADAFEQASVDEAYLEWKFEFRNSNFEFDPWHEAETRARKIKRIILEQEGLICSVGIGPNKLVAKIASDFQKPDGLTIVRSDEVEIFLATLSVRVIPGVGPKAETALQQREIKTVRDVYEAGPRKMAEWFDKWGIDLSRKAHGISDSPVSGKWVQKSIGVEETFEKDALNPAFILDRARALADQVFRRFQREGFTSFRTVVVTVRFADFETRTRSLTSPQPLRTLTALNGTVLKLLLPFLDQRGNPKRKPLRLVGARVEKIV